MHPVVFLAMSLLPLGSHRWYMVMMVTDSVPVELPSLVGLCRPLGLLLVGQCRLRRGLALALEKVDHRPAQ